MDKKFKWNMFITSFIPLWLSIMVSDIWSIVESGINNWLYEDNVLLNVTNICKTNWVRIAVVLIIGTLMIISIVSMNQFLKDKRGNNQPPKIKIKKATRANKLSSEF